MHHFPEPPPPDGGFRGCLILLFIILAGAVAGACVYKLLLQ